MHGWVCVSTYWTNATQHVLKMRIAAENSEQTSSYRVSMCVYAYQRVQMYHYDYYFSTRGLALVFAHAALCRSGSFR